MLIKINLVIKLLQYLDPPNEPIISLDSNLSSQSHNETLNDFDINLFNSENRNNLFDDVQATPYDFVTPDVGSHFEYERASSYDPYAIFGKAMGNEETDEIKWDLPQLDTEEKTGPRVLDKLATALNAAVSKRSVKGAISNIAKKYFRPENCTYLCAPKVNAEIWNAIDSQSHTQDLVLQDIQKSISLALVPIIQLAEQVVNPNTELDRGSIKTVLTDSLSLIGHAQFYISQRRRFNIRPYLNDKYKPICNSDVPLTNELFGNDCHKKIKELGDPTKIPIGATTSNYSKYGRRGRLNFRRPDHRRGGGRGYGRGGRRPARNPRGQGYNNYPQNRSNQGQQFNHY